MVSVGNEQLLDNLDEGVIILESISHKVLFLNRSAKRVQLADNTMSFESDMPLFALLDYQIFE